MEEPLQLLLDGEPLSVVMRTPGNGHRARPRPAFTPRESSRRPKDVKVVRISAESAESESAVKIEPRSVESNQVDVHLAGQPRAHARAVDARELRVRRVRRGDDRGPEARALARLEPGPSRATRRCCQAWSTSCARAGRFRSHRRAARGRALHRRATCRAHVRTSAATTRSTRSSAAALLDGTLPASSRSWSSAGGPVTRSCRSRSRPASRCSPPWARPRAWPWRWRASSIRRWSASSAANASTCTRRRSALTLNAQPSGAARRPGRRARRLRAAVEWTRALAATSRTRSCRRCVLGGAALVLAAWGWPAETARTGHLAARPSRPRRLRAGGGAAAAGRGARGRGPSPPAGLAVAAIAVSVGEEVAFRGALFAALEEVGGAPLAVVGSTALWTAAHALSHPPEFLVGGGGGRPAARAVAPGVSATWSGRSSATSSRTSRCETSRAARAARRSLYVVAAWMVAPGFYDGFAPPQPYNFVCPPPQAGANSQPTSGHLVIKVINGVSDANSAFTDDGQLVIGFLPGAFDVTARRASPSTSRR